MALAFLLKNRVSDAARGRQRASRFNRCWIRRGTSADCSHGSRRVNPTRISFEGFVASVGPYPLPRKGEMLTCQVDIRSSYNSGLPRGAHEAPHLREHHNQLTLCR